MPMGQAVACRGDGGMAAGYRTAVKMRKTVHKLAKGAEKTLVDLDKAVQQMHW